VPLVTPDMNIPLVRRIDVQLAGRYENYSDFGSVAKPKIAFAWDVVDGVRFRGSWQKGFRAPNLETTNPFAIREPTPSPTSTVARPTFGRPYRDLLAPVRAAWASASRPPAIRT
jgi:outer membrane receptor protein involved in Fe transport